MFSVSQAEFRRAMNAFVTYDAYLRVKENNFQHFL
jgi:hypothetical protein